MRWRYSCLQSLVKRPFFQKRRSIEKNIEASFHHKNYKKAKQYIFDSPLDRLVPASVTCLSSIIGAVILFAAIAVQGEEQLKSVTAVTAGETLPIRVVFFPFREATISARVDSVVEKYNYREGELFKKGAILVELDARRYRQIKNQMAAEYSEAQGQVIYFSKLYRSNLDLLKQGMQGEQVIAKNKLDLDNRKSNVVIAQAKLKLAELNLMACSITAPFAGRMATKKIKEHEFVRAGQPVFSIIDDNKLLAVVNVPQAMLKRVKIGQAMQIKLDSIAGSCQGKVYEISPALDYNSGTFEIKLLVDNSRHTLKAGMTGVLITAPEAVGIEQKISGRK